MKTFLDKADEYIEVGNPSEEDENGWNKNL